MRRTTHSIKIAAAAVLAALVAACSTQGTTEDKVSSFLVAPDKFVLFNCEQIAGKMVGTVARQKDLEALMAKAGPEAGGRLVSAVAYEPEYAELRGDVKELRNAAAAKNCKNVPAAGPEGKGSGSAVR